MRPQGPHRVALHLAIAAVAAMTSSGCLGQHEASAESLATTCQDWVALDLPVREALGDEDGLSDAQAEIAEDLLEAHGVSTSSLALSQFNGTVVLACAPDGTGTRPGGPIEELISWG